MAEFRFPRSHVPTFTPPRRRGIVLPVVLVLIGLLAITLAGFIFFVQAETSGMLAQRDGQQAHLAAESGFEEVIAMLRTEKHNSAAWFDNPARFRHALVWSPDYDRESDPLRKGEQRAELLKSDKGVKTAWRFSVVAPAARLLPDQEPIMRYGVTPEASKLNINSASDAQVEQLLAPLLLELGIENPQELINALLDWRDTDEEPRLGGAESEYYGQLEPPYTAKNGPLDSIEEMLLIRGFSPAVLFGEDANRNGILDANENDGEETFPVYDNADGLLNIGVAAVLTVWTREPDTALDAKPRINLLGDANLIRTQIGQYFQQGELSQATINFLGGGWRQSGVQIASVAELYTVGLPDEPSTPGAGGGPGGAGSPDGGGNPAGDGTGPPTSQPGDPPGGGIPRIRNSPITEAELPFVVDRFSATPPQAAMAGIPGLININTAPERVLRVIPGLTPEYAAALVAARGALDAATRRTIAWPVLTGTLPTDVWQAIAPYITTKAYQYHVEVVGYADHSKIMKRYEWIVEMIGPLGQIRYRRDLTQLGPAWPIDDDTIIAAAR